MALDIAEWITIGAAAVVGVVIVGCIFLQLGTWTAKKVIRRVR